MEHQADTTRREFLQHAGWLVCGLGLAGSALTSGCKAANSTTPTSADEQEPEPSAPREPVYKTVDGMQLVSTDDAPSLLWFTDVHGYAEGLARIAQFCADNSEFISDSLCTGDMMPTSCFDDFTYWTGAGAAGTLICMGNHDRASTASVYDAALNEQEAYKRYLAPFAAAWGERVHLVEGRTYYHVDYPSGGLRLLVVDGNIQVDPVLGEEVTWLSARLNEALEQGLAVVMACHFPPGGTDALFDCAFTSSAHHVSSSAKHYANQALVEAVDAFIAHGGEFVTWLAGHWHFDAVATLPDHPNQLMVVQSSEIPSRERGDLARSEGDATADCFNYVSFDRAQHTLTIARFGARTTTNAVERAQITIDYANKLVIA